MPTNTARRCAARGTSTPGVERVISAATASTEHTRAQHTSCTTLINGLPGATRSTSSVAAEGPHEKCACNAGRRRLGHTDLGTPPPVAERAGADLRCDLISHPSCSLHKPRRDDISSVASVAYIACTCMWRGRQLASRHAGVLLRPRCHDVAITRSGVAGLARFPTQGTASLVLARMTSVRACGVVP